MYPMVEPEKIFDEKWPVVFKSPYKEEWAPPLSTCLKNIIKDVEELFGPRDKDFVLLGVDFLFEGGPHLSVRDKTAVIQLEKAAFLDFELACLQCAHECVHLLSPSLRRETTYLEEGVATYFANWLDSKADFNRGQLLLEEYQVALVHVEKLLNIDPNAIRVLRQHDPKLSKISKYLLLALYPSLGEAAADVLTRRFYNDDGEPSDSNEF
ncbi:hypothetical protein F6V30_14490 [Oryzomonas sagensis]|uniref:Uncharacterized protein n=1 Tax=Oryzomonas sagensis TaxID=2603857 RepID=A0ABQ6TLH4_9BACT|nr:hypothetical protein [Oryzomonas sagensis]KAB0669041.1 hypothetical protein F6V30_14490 [Oryzomonas sagensis]